MNTRKKLIGIALAGLLQTSCGPLLQTLEAFASMGAKSQYMGTLVDVAEDHAKAFLLRHPSRELRDEVAQVVSDVRLALLVLDAAIAVSGGVETKDVVEARRAVQKAYEALYSRFDSSGIRAGQSPTAGAEVDAPKPRPVPLPTPGEVEKRLAP